jgi:hypothetical protein
MAAARASPPYHGNWKKLKTLRVATPSSVRDPIKKQILL